MREDGIKGGKWRHNNRKETRNTSVHVFFHPVVSVCWIRNPAGLQTLQTSCHLPSWLRSSPALSSQDRARSNTFGSSASKINQTRRVLLHGKTYRWLKKSNLEQNNGYEFTQWRKLTCYCVLKLVRSWFKTKYTIFFQHKQKKKSKKKWKKIVINYYKHMTCLGLKSIKGSI